MSGLGLFERDINERTATLNITDQVEPGVFDNFFYGAGMATARTAAKAASGLDLAASVGPILKDYITGGTEAQDRWFKEHDNIFKNAVDYWTPKPNETGIAGEITGQLLATLPMVIASPALATAQMQMSTAEDLVNKGVSPQRANVVGGVVGAGFGLGVWMPILGQNLWQRVAIGGAGFNAAQGIVTRGAAGALLEGTPAAKDFEAFSPVEITLDVLLGAAFGGLVHLSPQGRAQGAKAWQDIKAWAEKLTPTQKDALATLRQAQHLNMDSMPPGKPVTPESINEHVLRMRQAIDQMARDEPVNVDQPPATPVEAVEPGIPDTSPTERAPSPLDKYSETPNPLAALDDTTLQLVGELGDYADMTRGMGIPEADWELMRAQGLVETGHAEDGTPYEFVNTTHLFPERERRYQAGVEQRRQEREARIAAENAARAAEMVQAAEETRLEHEIPELPQELGGRLQDLSALPVDQQPQAIANAVAGALRGVGVPDEEARGSGAIWGAFFKVMGERPGQTPASLLEKYGVNIRRMGEGQALADALDQAGYHGTHALFDRFSLQKIGSGEGAQAYGWGLYFSSSKEVAQWYKENVTRRRSQEGMVLVDEHRLDQFINNDLSTEDEAPIRAYIEYRKAGLDEEKARGKALREAGHDLKKFGQQTRMLADTMIQVEHEIIVPITHRDEPAYRLPSGEIVHQRFIGPKGAKAMAARELLNSTYAQAVHAKQYDDASINPIRKIVEEDPAVIAEIENALAKGEWPATIQGAKYSKKNALEMLQRKRLAVSAAQEQIAEAEAYRKSLEEWTTPGRPPETLVVGGDPIVLYEDIQGSISKQPKNTDPRWGDIQPNDEWRFVQTGASPKMFPTLEAAKAYADAGNRVVTAKLERVVPPKPTGRLYEVEIPDQAHMLDWDKPFADQPEALKKLFREVYPKAEGMDLTGKFLYRRLVNMIEEPARARNPVRDWAMLWKEEHPDANPRDEELASRYLNAHGVPGISYEGGTSRVRNYVVFDDSNVQITRFEQRDPVRPSPAVLEALKDTKVVDTSGKPLQVYHGTNADIEVFNPHSLTSVHRLNGKEIKEANSWDMGEDRTGMPEGYHYGALSDAAVLGAKEALRVRTEEATRLGHIGKPDTDRMLADLKRLQDGELTWAAESRPNGSGSWFTPDPEYSFISRRNTGQDPGANVIPVYLNIKNPIYLNSAEIESAGRDFMMEKYKAQGYDGAIYAPDKNDLTKSGFNGSTQIVAFYPEQIKSVFNDRPTSDPRILYQDDRADRTFYSELERKIKAAPMKSAPAQGWRDYIKSQIGKGVKQDEIEATGIYDWLDLEGAPKPVPEPGFRVVEEYRADDGTWAMIDDLGIIGKTEEEARAQITDDLLRATERHGQEDQIEARLNVVPHDRLNFGKVEHPKITREQVQQFMADNGVRVVTKQAGGRKLTATQRTLADAAIRDDMEYLRENDVTVEEDPGDPDRIGFMQDDDIGTADMYDEWNRQGQLENGTSIVEAMRRIEAYWNGSHDVQADGTLRPRYAKNDYLLPGGEKQVELLLTLPPKTNDRLPPGYSLQSDGSNWTLIRPDNTGDRLIHLNLNAPEAIARQEAIRRLERDGVIEKNSSPIFTQNHFPDTENLLAHTRGNERTVPVDDLKDSHPELHARLTAEGRTEAKLFFVEEVQSDWSQRGGEHGFRDEERIRKLTAEHDAMMRDLGSLGGAASEVVSRYPLLGTARSVDAMLGHMDWTFRKDPSEEMIELQYGITDKADREIVMEYMQALRRERELEAALTSSKGTIPAAPFVAKRTFGIFKDGAELERADKNGKTFSERYDTREAAEAAAKKAGGEVRDMGLTEDTQAWSSLVAKRILRYAAEQGADLIAWTTGAQQVDRWSSALRRKVDAIEWKKTPEGIHLVGYKGGVRPEKRYRVRNAAGENLPDWVNGYRTEAEARDDYVATTGRTPEDDGLIIAETVARGNPGTKVVDTTEKENALSDAIGKTMAEQIISDPNQSGTIEGADITVSSTGMAGFYDRVWPAVLNKVSKQIGGGKVNTLEMPLPGFNPTKIPPHPTTAEPTWHEMSDFERQVYAGIDDFPGDGKPPLAEATTLLIGDREIDVDIMLSPQGLHIVGEDAAGNPFEWLYDNFRPSVLAYRDDLARAVKLIWDDPELTLWGNLRAVLGDLPHDAKPKQNRSPQMSLEITPAMREKIMAGLPLFQRAPTEPNMAGSLRGQIQFGDGETVIGLFKGANPTTFMHETGHLFLEITKDLAGRADAPEQALQDWATLSQWLKIEGGPVTREAHEQFARTWEQYLGTGEAPTPELRSVFQAFRDWILEVYQDLKNIIGAKLNPEIRGVLDRMLASQRADPADRAEGPQVPAKESGLPPPPPPETEAGPADPEALMRPEGDEQAVLDAQRSIQEAEAAQTPPAAEQGLVDPLPMEDPELRSELQAMANEAGWAQIGGRNLGNVMGVPNFSTWIPKAEWWPGRPDKMNEAKTREAVRKALAGEPLKAAEKRLIDYMKDYASKQIRALREIPEERRAEIANALIAEELEATPKNTIDLDEVARANELDEAAVERAAIRYADDDTAFMAEIRAINEQGRKAAESRKTAETGQEGEAGTGQGADTGTGKDAALDPLAEAAQRFVDENPDRMITVGQEPDGTPIRMTSREYLEQSRADVAQAIEDSKLFDAAAGCLLGNA